MEPTRPDLHLQAGGSGQDLHCQGGQDGGVGLLGEVGTTGHVLPGEEEGETPDNFYLDLSKDTTFHSSRMRREVYW